MNKEQDWERKNRVYDLRLRGKSYRQIAAIEGISAATAHRWVQEILDLTVMPNVDAIRKQEVDRLMRYLDMLDERIEDGDDKAISLAIKISERLTKMTGADMPTQHVIEKVETTQVDLAIRELIDSQNARNALRREEAASLRQAEVSSDRMSFDDTSEGDGGIEQIVMED